MFRSARVKLTLWYLLIIMTVSFSFSVVIYEFLSGEVERLAMEQRLRIEQKLYEMGFSPYEARLRISPNLPLPDPGLVNETKQRIIFSLAIVNGAIFFVAGGLGYLLAGKTLSPIQEMMQDQNRFISDASHELKTPLTSLKTAFEVFLRDKSRTKSDADQLVEESISEVDKLQQLSESLLQLAQYQRPQTVNTFEAVSALAIVKEATKKVEPQARKKQITLNTDAVENVQILGSMYSLIDLVVILLDNAIKYSAPDTTVTLSTKSRKNTVEISVADQGIGIIKSDLPHIFDRFYRSDTARCKSESGGYGLGLSIAKRIIDSHKGEIVVKSSTKGSTFTLILSKP